jgi:predicted RNA-binding protein YlqC (UPF0109 family)
VERVAVCLARVLVDEPARVEAEEFEEGDTTVIELSVAPPDLGRVIGRHGRTADALRTIIEALGRRKNRSYELEILD